MTKPLPIVGYINPLVADALRDPTSGINITQLRAEPVAGVSQALVMRADAEEEIARYRVALTEAKTFHEEQDKYLSKQPPSFQRLWRRNLHQEQIEQIEAALKGPEA